MKAVWIASLLGSLAWSASAAEIPWVHSLSEGFAKSSKEGKAIFLVVADWD